MLDRRPLRFEDLARARQDPVENKMRGSMCQEAHQFILATMVLLTQTLPKLQKTPGTATMKAWLGRVLAAEVELLGGRKPGDEVFGNMLNLAREIAAWQKEVASAGSSSSSSSNSNSSKENDEDGEEDTRTAVVVADDRTAVASATAQTTSSMEHEQRRVAPKLEAEVKEKGALAEVDLQLELQLQDLEQEVQQHQKQQQQQHGSNIMVGTDLTQLKGSMQKSKFLGIKQIEGQLLSSTPLIDNEVSEKLGELTTEQRPVVDIGWDELDEYENDYFPQTKCNQPPAHVLDGTVTGVAATGTRRWADLADIDSDDGALTHVKQSTSTGLQQQLPHLQCTRNKAAGRRRARRSKTGQG